MAGHLARPLHTVRKHGARQLQIFITVDPALNAALRPLGNKVLSLGGSAQQIHLPEGIFPAVQRLGAVQKGFQLTAQLIIIDGRGKRHHLRDAQLFQQRGHIVPNHAAAGFLAGGAAPAELNLPAAQADQLHLMARLSQTALSVHGNCCPAAGWR